MLKIMIVEDDRQLSSILQYMVEDNPRYRVVGIAEDGPGALTCAADSLPDLALVDLHLANGSTGYGVAARLNDDGIPCLFVTGRAPGFAMPDLALGCLMKPFTSDDVHRALGMAEDAMRGRETLRPRPPRNFELYETEPEPVEPTAAFGGVATGGSGGAAPLRRSFGGRLAAWVSGSAH
jgi:two-component system, response regulator PdtaR